MTISKESNKLIFDRTIDLDAVQAVNLPKFLIGD